MKSFNSVFLIIFTCAVAFTGCASGIGENVSSTSRNSEPQSDTECSSGEQQSSDAAPDETSDKTSGETSGKAPDRTSGKTPGETSNKTPGGTSGGTPGEASALPDLRILLSSDIHCTDLLEWYGVDYRTRMQHWVDAVLQEHKEKKFDLVVINGDISLDYWANGGSVLTKGKGTSEIFIKEYLSQLPDDLPVFILPGNHEQYSDQDWFELTGNHRQGYMELGGRLFIFLDNFRGELDPKYHQDGVYTETDVKYIEKVMAEYPKHDVYLIAHYFNTNAESPEFEKLVKENPRIKALFAGHTHKSAVVELGEDWGNKTIAQTGNFAYFKDSAKLSFWGFRELVLTEKAGYSQYILAKSEATVDGVKQCFDRTIRAQVCYYGNAPEILPDNTFSAKYNTLYSKIDKTSVSGDAGVAESESVQRIFDENPETKWCVRPTAADGSVSVYWNMTEAVNIDAYAISTANDDLSRSPNAWTLYARNNEKEDWTIISKITEGNLPKELFTFSEAFPVEKKGAYKYYKMTFTENFNNRTFYQFSELALLQKK